MVVLRFGGDYIERRRNVKAYTPDSGRSGGKGDAGTREFG
jgi:hypothetical protein